MKITHDQEAVKLLAEDDAFFSSIGRFIFQFSQLEYAIRVTVANAAGLADEHFNAIMTHDFALLCTVAQTVFSTCLSKDQLPKLEALISRLRRLNEERVRVVHGLWVVTIEGGKLHHVSRNKLRAQTHFDEPRGEAIARLADLASELRWEWEQTLWGFTS